MGDVAAFDMVTGKLLWNTPLNTGRADHMTLDARRRSISSFGACSTIASIGSPTATGEITGHLVTGVYPHDNKISHDGRLLYNTSIGADRRRYRARPNAQPLAETPGTSSFS